MRSMPEILAPAGDMPSLRAALAAGADAVYFGLDEGLNARGRATNFSLAELGRTVALIHRAGARAYLTLNTLVFEPELATLERILRQVAAAGADAIIVQDPAVALLARAVCPALEVHASTQMTVSSPEGARFARSLGCNRVVVPRELSVAEIRRFAEASDMELEVFIHGALCVSWSGQCLTSEAWGGRSANRGQCAQSCRMPYDLVIDGQTRDLGDVRYLLSPQDLAGVRAVPALAEIGVSSLKIEGRQKGPHYVATAVEGYRRWRDAVAAGAGAEARHALAQDLASMALAYSRGFTDGFLAGSDHQTLVEGRFPKARGVYLGRVVAVRGSDVVVARDPEGRPWTGGLGLDERPEGPNGTVASPLDGTRGGASAQAGVDVELEIKPADLPDGPRPGMGVVFDAGRPEDRGEPGGPIFSVAPWTGGGATGRAGWVLGFGRPGPDLDRVTPGQRVWITSDPAIARRVERLIETEPMGRHAVDLRVSGAPGEPLVVHARAGRYHTTCASTSLLAPARGAGITAELLADKLGSLGGTPLRLGTLDTSELTPGMHLPVSELKELRRRLAADLVHAIERGPERTLAAGPVVEALRAEARAQASTRASAWQPPAEPQLLPLCRNDAQLDAVLAAGLPDVELDWMEFVGLGHAVARARAAGVRVTVATTRVQKVGEEGFDGRIARLGPDAVLARHWGAVVSFLEQSERPANHSSERPANHSSERPANHSSERHPAHSASAATRPVLHGDFSLNVTNSITAGHLLAMGVDTLTCAHDLDETQLFAMLDQVPAERFTVVVHHHIATFHTEHCVYAHLLSSGRDFRSCGRPCERHEISLRDRVDLVHPVLVDVGCRNTVFNAQAQSAAALVPRLLERGVRRFRVELVRESRDETARVIAAYRALLAGRISPREAVRQAGGHEQFGVTRGTMRVLQ